ncbi:MAG: Trk system potassium uptake protein TrkA [Tenericutes bacterium ADurb.BinA155]|jgi:trk system potassium uptake protein|nr:MAG: Trk system potassium uptake protein TrkA [Tenericutes bacterium ADurb.BinA155]
MKIVIANGTYEAEFIIKMFHKRDNQLVVINGSKEEADLILKREHIQVYVGEPWRNFVLQESNAHDADIFISLCEHDSDNYASCLLAKKCFGAKKCICVVNNPTNVDLYKSLGIDSVISSTYLLGQSVKSESTVEDLMKTLSLENNKIVIVEAVILSKFKIAGKKLMNIAFPKYASISCIYRNGEVVIPNGQVDIRTKDKLLITCAPEDQNKVMAFIEQEK